MASVSKVRGGGIVSHTDKKSKSKKHLSHNEKKVAKTADESFKKSSTQALLERAKKWAPEKEAKKLLSKHGQKVYERVITACENIWKLDAKLGIKEHELFQMAVFIETEMKAKVDKGETYFHHNSKKPGHARSIQYIKKSKLSGKFGKSKIAVIHLKSHNNKALGKGNHKTVTLSLLYDVHKPHVMANCAGDKSVKLEAKVIKKLNGKEGIPQTYVIGKHKDKATHKKVYSLFQHPYNAHSLRTYQYRLQPITRHEQLILARDVAHGLENMHNERLCHSDLHGANILCDRRKDPETGQERFSATLIDFGQVKTFDEAKKSVPQVEVPRRLTTPEALLKGKHRVDVRKIETFAFGWNLYFLYFGKEPAWSENKKFYDMRHMSTRQREKFSKELAHDINKEIEMRKKEINSSDPVWNEFGKFILTLCDPDPKKRPAAHKARKVFNEMLKLHSA